MVTDLRKKHRAPRDAQGTRPARVDSAWPYVLAAIALIVVVVAAELMLTQRPEAARVRTGSYAELARAEAREGSRAKATSQSGFRANDQMSPRRHQRKGTGSRSARAGRTPAP